MEGEVMGRELGRVTDWKFTQDGDRFIVAKKSFVDVESCFVYEGPGHSNYSDPDDRWNISVDAARRWTYFSYREENGNCYRISISEILAGKINPIQVWGVNEW